MGLKMAFDKKHKVKRKAGAKMLKSHFNCKNCKEIIYITRLGSWWCVQCGERKEQEEIE